MKNPKQIVRWLTSPQTIAGVKIIVAFIAFIQAIDDLNSVGRKIGFKTKK
jgi:hypothetical protein